MKIAVLQNGCGLLHTTNSISIEDGYFCIRGRFLQDVGGSTFEIEPTAQNDIYCRLVCEIDLSQENTTSELKQVDYKILKSTNGYPALTQQDITAIGEGDVYQFEFAQFKVTEQGIEDFVDKRTHLDFHSIYTEIRNMLSGLETTAKEEITTLITDLNVFCDTAKEVLDENVAMNLLNLINNKADMPRSKTITLLVAGWTLNETTKKYEYTIQDSTITEDDYINVDVLDRENEEVLATIDGYNYDGSYVFINDELPKVDIALQLVIFRTQKEVTV